jgi:hypothetical protein
MDNDPIREQHILFQIRGRVPLSFLHHKGSEPSCF